MSMERFRNERERYVCKKMAKCIYCLKCEILNPVCKQAIVYKYQLWKGEIYILRKNSNASFKVCHKKQKNNNKLWIVGKDSRLCFCFVKYSQLVQFPGSVVIPPSQNKLFAARSRWVGLFAWPSPGSRFQPRFQVYQISGCLRPRFTCQVPGLASYMGRPGDAGGAAGKTYLLLYVHAGEGAQNWMGPIFICPVSIAQSNMIWRTHLCLFGPNAKSFIQ